jgi:DNA-binding transcriptional LysR family regulator
VNLGWLETFIQVVEQGSISEGAKELNLTQPAVSKQIKNLEQYYGVLLLERSNRESKPTEAGKFIYHRAKEVLSKINNLKEEMTIFRTELRGRVRMGASSIPGEYVLPREIALFHRTYPYVQLSLEIGDSEGIIQGLKRDKYDFAVVGSVIDSGEFTFQPYTYDSIVPIARSGHPLQELKRISPQGLIGETIVWREEGSGTRLVVEEKLERLKLLPGDLVDLVQLGSTEAVVNAVEAGIGISFVSKRAAQKGIEAGRLTILNFQGFPLERKLYLVTITNKYLSEAAQKMIDFLLQKEKSLENKES